MNKVLSCILYFVVLAASQTALAHDLGIARLDIRWLDETRLEVSAGLPDSSNVQDPILPAHCDLASSESSYVTGSLNRQWLFDCQMPSDGGPGEIRLPWAVDGLFVGNSETGYFVDRGETDFVLPLSNAADQQSRSAFSDYLVFGISHILSGWDHLAFVLALCLLVSGWRLLLLVSMFTVGHSITLALAALGLVNLPSAPLEASIALSIAFMAREVILKRSEPGGVGLVLAFGLLHGMGFAGALVDFGFDGSSAVVPLLAFNIGVEIGQLIFVAAVLTVQGLASSRYQEKAYVSGVAWAIGALGMFWTIERMSGVMLG